MGGLNLWQGNTTLTHLQIYDVLAGLDGAGRAGPLLPATGVGDDRRAPARMALREARRADAGVLEGRQRGARPPRRPQRLRPGRAARLVAIELVLVLPYLALLALAIVGSCASAHAAGRAAARAGGAYNAAHVAAYATTRFRLPILPVLFMLAAALLVGRGDASLAPLRGATAGAPHAAGARAIAVLAPGMEELLTWRRLTGRS
jgi:hypothetical protein